MEPAILETIELFTCYAKSIESRAPNSRPEFSLTVKIEGYSDKTPIARLHIEFYDGKNYNSFDGASLGELIAETHRRLGWATKEIIKIDALQAQLRALPAPLEPSLSEALDDEIPF